MGLQRGSWSMWLNAPTTRTTCTFEIMAFGFRLKADLHDLHAILGPCRVESEDLLSELSLAMVTGDGFREVTLWRPREPKLEKGLTMAFPRVVIPLPPYPWSSSMEAFTLMLFHAGLSSLVA
ncbi:hypothetical protein VNO77_39092 [Canavalia gladiata]|uniref:Uncharacterized protein n=1 Tax=Canavalia gladiata TaxID=3824 RepID=A0AAN9KCR4_CANGL